MTGLEFCKEFRGLGRENYGYFVLLTSKSEKTEIADGLEAGADDFLTKPVSSNELRARLRAGERMLAMQAELLAKNKVIVSTLVELQKLYDSLDRDLIEARKLQQTLIRDRVRDYGWARVSLILRNSGRVGGDLVGSFRVDDDRVVVYSIDVSGHGVASAMMTARLAGFLTGSSPGTEPCLPDRAGGRPCPVAPAAVVERFNRLMLEEIQAEQYFTMAFAVIDRRTGQLDLVQAGHPHPMLIRADGRVQKAGRGRPSRRPDRRGGFRSGPGPGPARRPAGPLFGRLHRMPAAERQGFRRGRADRKPARFGPSFRLRPVGGDGLGSDPRGRNRVLPRRCLGNRAGPLTPGTGPASPGPRHCPAGSAPP
jgi:hypothetical protein